MMATASVRMTRPAISMRSLVPGLVAGMVIGMWEMVVEAIIGAGFLAPLVFIAATVLRNLQGVAVPVPFDLVAAVVGLMGHMMNAVIIGLIFAFLIAPRVHSLGGKVVAGIVYGVLIFAMMWFVVLPLVDPVMLKLNVATFFVGHMMFGAVLGLLSPRSNRTQ